MPRQLVAVGATNEPVAMEHGKLKRPVNILKKYYNIL